jgi:uncharacterized protein (DUF1501 family)
MNLSRRDLLRLGTSSLVACGAGVPLFLARTAQAVAAGPGAKARGRVLVVVQLDGGNDGLNTVVPYRDDEYRKHRPRLQIAARSVARIDDRVGFHPALTGFARLLEAGRLAVVQSVGYPNPNRSHFESMAVWQAARLGARGDAPGWLARVLDGRNAEAGGDAGALHVGAGPLPQALAGGRQPVPSLAGPGQLRRRLGIADEAGAREQRAALDRVAGGDRGAPGSLLQLVQRSVVQGYAGSARLEGVLARGGGSAGYPESFGLARRLGQIAGLVKAGLTTSLYYTRLGGFDTHAGQLGAHDRLLREVGSSLWAFMDDLDRSGDGRRVLVLVFSEFGRRLAENASGGTDHGTAAPVFLLGGTVAAGLHGPYPDLGDLHDGDPRHAINFRRVYATLLDRWLGFPADRVLGAKFEHLPVLAG